jgi:glycerophosphoryl diester phosphodiesterase
VIAACRADAFGCAFEELTPELMQNCVQYMIPVGVYTINTREDLLAAIKLGVRGVVTNYPDRLQQVLVELKLTSHTT